MSSPVPAADTPPQTAPAYPTFLGHPRPLFTLFFAEMWERFSYYGMRALLILFMTLPAARAGLGLSTKDAALIYGIYTMSVYMMSIVGGTFADNIFGARAAVFLGGITIACGHFCMAFPSKGTFFIGLVLIVIGTGFLKPNISALVGGLYGAKDNRRDAGFSIFYTGINLGSFTGSIITGFLAQHSKFKALLASWGFNPDHSWHWAFGAAGVGMVLGLIVFFIFGKGLKEVGSRPPATPDAAKKSVIVLIGTLGLWGIVWLSDKTDLYGVSFTWLRPLFLLVPVALMFWFGYSKDQEMRRMGAVIYFFIGATIFWGIFEQAGSTMNLFARDFTATHIAGVEVPPSWYQSVNAFFVITLAPTFAFIWTKLGDRQPSSPMKFTLGLLAVTCGFTLMVQAAKLAGEGRVSPLWLIGLYFFQTVGELCLSPVGLSTFTKLSPARLVGVMLGIWFLASAFGNKLAGVLASNFGEGDASNLDRFFGQQAIGVGIVAVIYLAMVPWVRRRMGGVR